MLRPCLNPAICGVQNHRPGTVCKASDSVANSGGSGQSNPDVPRSISTSELSRSISEKMDLVPTEGGDYDIMWNGQVVGILAVNEEQENELLDHIDQPINELLDTEQDDHQAEDEFYQVLDAKIAEQEFMQTIPREAGQPRPTRAQATTGLINDAGRLMQRRARRKRAKRHAREQRELRQQKASIEGARIRDRAM